MQRIKIFYTWWLRINNLRKRIIKILNRTKKFFSKGTRIIIIRKNIKKRKKSNNFKVITIIKKEVIKLRIFQIYYI